MAQRAPRHAWRPDGRAGAGVAPGAEGAPLLPDARPRCWFPVERPPGRDAQVVPEVGQAQGRVPRPERLEPRYLREAPRRPEAREEVCAVEPLGPVRPRRQRPGGLRQPSGDVARGLGQDAGARPGPEGQGRCEGEARQGPQGGCDSRRGRLQGAGPRQEGCPSRSPLSPGSCSPRSSAPSRSRARSEAEEVPDTGARPDPAELEEPVEDYPLSGRCPGRKKRRNRGVRLDIGL